jgi:hypothetical protein
LVGGYFLLLNWELPYMVWLLVAWLVVETILFATLLWYIEDWRNDYFQLTPSRLVLVEPNRSYFRRAGGGALESHPEH